MKRYLPLGLILLTLVLFGCSTQRTATMNMDLTKEAWMSQVETNPNRFTIGADAWFLSGKPSSLELATRRLGGAAAISTMSVMVPRFNQIRIDGDFQVQIFGTYGSNSVYLLGDNESVRGISVEVRNGMLCVTQAKKAPRRVSKVIVRIGVNQLSSLVHHGRGCIEGVQLHSNGLSVTSYASGNMYLGGNLRLVNVTKAGTGNISILGANTPVLDIKTAGVGAVNISGNVGVRSIIHHGRTDINIIGANTNGLKIHADGRGKIGINGIVNLREVVAKDFVGVYVMKLKSPALYVTTYGKAHVGLAGCADNFYADAFRYTCVSGKFLCANAAYVRSHDGAHINISANKVFAAATDNSSIYLFSSPAIASQFVSGKGVVIPIWGGPKFCSFANPVPVVATPYKGDVSYSKWKKRQHVRKPLRLKGEG